MSIFILSCCFILKALIKLDPPNISKDGVVPSSNKMNGLPDLILLDKNRPLYHVKANTSVMMGKNSNVNSVRV